MMGEGGGMISVKLAGFDRGRGVIRAGAGVSTLGISEEPLTPPPATH